MNAPLNTTDQKLSALRSLRCDWGDMYTGTKPELQAVGFGIDEAFPGEPGANKRKAQLRPALGYQLVTVEISRANQNGAETTYEVRAGLLDDSAWFVTPKEHFAEGVIRERHAHWDSYVGRAEAMIAAGLCTASQLPGAPGCGKTTTTFDANGKRLSGEPRCGATARGMISVNKRANRIEVCTPIDDAEKARRNAAYHQARESWVLKCKDARLIWDRRSSAQRPRPALRLATLNGTLL